MATMEKQHDPSQLEKLETNESGSERFSGKDEHDEGNEAENKVRHDPIAVLRRS